MKLFDNITELSSPISFHISNESDISPQLNDAFIPMFTNEIRKLKEHCKSNEKTYSKVSEYEKDKVIQDHLRKMCDLILDRFGINFDIIFEPNIYLPNLCVFNLPVNDASLKNIPNTKTIVKKYGEKNKKGIDKILVDCCIGIEEQIKKSAIIVDYSKAKIKGIPSHAKNVIIISVPLLIDTYDEITPEELVAGLLHEIGHTFFHYLYCYNTYSKTLSLTQGMLDYVNDKNKDPKEALILSYIDVTNDKSVLEYKNKNPIFINVEVQRRMTIYNKQNSAFSSVENEAHSDRFTAAFGMGDHLASFLFKFHKLSSGGNVSRYKYRHDEIGCAYTWFDTYGEIWKFIFAFCLPVGMLITHGLAAGFVLGFIFIGYPVLITNIIRTMWFNQNGTVYDNPFERIMRIKASTVSLLKTLNLPKNEMKTILEKVDNIEKNLLEYNKSSFFGSINKLLGTITFEPNTWFSLKTSPYLCIERQLEQLMNNDLYTASARIKIL